MKRHLYSTFWPSSIRWRVIVEQDFQCYICGYIYGSRVDKKGKKIPLHVHHVNGNTFDNSRDNLIALCPACHKNCHR